MSRFADRGAPRAWAVTWLAYASYYVGRKGFSVSKKTMSVELGMSEATLGAIDTVYLSAYALGQFASGLLGDRFGARRLVALGMVLSAAACGAFGSARSALWFGAFFLVNGLAQSSGWPGTTRAMAEWTTPKNRGTVMSFWSTCYQVGGIAASWGAGYLLAHYGWRATFFAPALWLACVGLLVFFLLRPGPHLDDPVAAPDAVARLETTDAPETLSLKRKQALLAVLQNGVLWSYGASYFFIKFIRYTLLFWLPYYLSNSLGYPGDDAAYVSSAFEIGGIVGVIATGIVSDRIPALSRSALSAVILFGLCLALLLYTRTAHLGIPINAAVLALIGALLFGPDSLLSGAAAQDAGGRYGAATATGMVNGVGSFGAILQGLVLPRISARFGWDAVFPVLVALAFASVVALVPTFFGKRPAPQA